jgi:hypothetical protein
MPTLARSLPILHRAPVGPESAVTEIETALTRRSVGALVHDRVLCHDCRRTPLVGELMYLYGETAVCELCRPRHRGAPDSSALVRSPGHERVVRALR